MHIYKEKDMKTSTYKIPHLSKNAIVVLEKRYLRKGEDGQVIETPADMFRRVADSIAAAEERFNANADTAQLTERFYNAMAGL
jgi:ribonucleoside-diphosphate reductase alpha chain